MERIRRNWLGIDVDDMIVRQRTFWSVKGSKFKIWYIIHLCTSTRQCTWIRWSNCGRYLVYRRKQCEISCYQWRCHAIKTGHARKWWLWWLFRSFDPHNTKIFIYFKFEAQHFSKAIIEIGTTYSCVVTALHIFGCVGVWKSDHDDEPRPQCLIGDAANSEVTSMPTTKPSTSHSPTRDFRQQVWLHLSLTQLQVNTGPSRHITDQDNLWSDTVSEIGHIYGNLPNPRLVKAFKTNDIWTSGYLYM